MIIIESQFKLWASFITHPAPDAVKSTLFLIRVSKKRAVIKFEEALLLCKSGSNEYNNQPIMNERHVKVENILMKNVTKIFLKIKFIFRY